MKCPEHLPEKPASVYVTVILDFEMLMLSF
jgi:hypothetical protein